MALSLENEQFTAVKAGSSATPTCDPNGTSTIDFSMSGVAIGPYPGTFMEMGTATIGPQVGPGTPLFGFPFPAGPVLSFHSSFTITSPVGMVTGTKSFDILVPGVASGGSGDCVSATGGSGDPFDQLCEELAGQPANPSIIQYEAIGSADYNATITTADGGFHDSGQATFLVQGVQGACGSTSFGDGFQNGFETFYTSSGVVPLLTPGKATGGGAIAGATFGFNAQSDGAIDKGHCEVMVGTHVVHCLDVTTYTQSGNRATFSGDALVDGAPARYTIDVTDNAEPGIGKDTFSIVTSSGVSASGVLTAGNIQVHQ